MIYLLISLGLTLIFGLMDVINFAHGALVTLGAYFGLTAWGVTGSYWIAFISLILGAMILGIVLERGLVKRLYDVDNIYQLLLTFGIALIIEGLIILYYGEENQRLDTPAFTTGDPISIGSAVVPRYRLYIIVIALVLVSAIWLAIERTQLGLIIKAGIQDRERTKLLGIRLGRINMIVFGVGAGLAAIGGFLAGPLLGVNPQMGSNLLIISFAIVIVGGLGSIRGTIVSSVLLGVAYNIALVFYPIVANAIIFIVMGAVLILKPSGLFGGVQA